MVRSILLRGFDQAIAEKIGAYMENHGLKFARQCVPTKYSKLDNGRILVEDKLVKTEEYDTCLLAIGRTADTKNIGLEQVGIKTSKSEKILTDDYEKSNVDNIYAIGDCAEGRPELTPPAIMAGKLLSRRLFSNFKLPMDYVNVATAVFTPIEYGAVGYSEEDALKKYAYSFNSYRFGKENLKIYHSTFVPVEWRFDLERNDKCYVKVIVNTADNNRVVGFHILSPNAGEITQGIAVAIKCGLTKEHLDETVGIHPTVAEVKFSLLYSSRNLLR